MRDWNDTVFKRFENTIAIMPSATHELEYARAVKEKMSERRLKILVSVVRFRPGPPRNTKKLLRVAFSFGFVIIRL